MKGKLSFLFRVVSGSLVLSKRKLSEVRLQVAGGETT